MGNFYLEMCARQQKEIGTFTIRYAFDKKRLAEVMKELGVTSVDDLVGTYGGGCMKRPDYEAYLDTLRRHGQERMEAIRKDKTGKGFIREMFAAELAADEYGFTEDDTGVLDMLGLTAEDFEAIPALSVGLNLAKQAQRNPFDSHPRRKRHQV